MIAIVDTAETTDGADGDVKILCESIPVDAVLLSVKVATDDLVGDATMSVGFYKQDDAPLGATFTEVDKDIIANDIDVNDAALALTEVRFSALGIETAKKKVWELAGLTARPDYNEMFLAATFETDTEAAATVTFQVQYIAQ